MLSEVEGFIFDLDDTIVKTESLNVQLIENYFKKQWGFNLDEFDKKYVYGHSWQQIYSFLINKYKIKIQIYVVQKSITNMKREFLKNNKIIVATGLDKVLNLPQQKAIVSGSGREEVEMILEYTGMSNQFRIICSVDDYKNGKPKPDGFLMALRLMNLSSKNVLAFEDSMPGIKAAKNANIRTVFMREFVNKNYSYMADYSFKTFNEFYSFFMKREDV
ncbi:MAG: HAD family phosphatase [Bacteroidia bacterium]|nr:HAD family phosphatase [Bacteroidia bacterium]